MNEIRIRGCLSTLLWCNGVMVGDYCKCHFIRELLKLSPNSQVGIRLNLGVRSQEREMMCGE